MTLASTSMSTVTPLSAVKTKKSMSPAGETTPLMRSPMATAVASAGMLFDSTSVTSTKDSVRGTRGTAALLSGTTPSDREPGYWYPILGGRFGGRSCADSAPGARRQQAASTTMSRFIRHLLVAMPRQPAFRHQALTNVSVCRRGSRCHNQIY